jgi:hypothetical protein
MIEKLIENWLINVHELGYQIPFCEVLLTQKYSILHVSTHGRGEHGKDVIARDVNRQLFAFQLKGGDITLRSWREMRGEVEELVQLPVSVTLPTIVSRGESHIPVLVTNGELRGDAPTSIQSFADTWEAKGSSPLQVWQKHQLLGMFVEAHGSYLPVKLPDFREFVELYVANFHDRIPRKRTAQFLEKLVSPEIVRGRSRKTKRAIESMMLLGAYLVEPYERVENHVSALEGWTIVATTIFHVAEREKLPAAHFEESLELVWRAIVRNLEKLSNEVFQRGHFVEPAHIIAETDFIRGVRTLLTLGWLTAASLIRAFRGEDDPEMKQLLEIVKRACSKISILGEADWPSIVCLSLFLERMVRSGEAEALLEIWVQSIIKANKSDELGGLPPPYWLQEKVLALRYEQLPPHKQELFSEHSYTVHSALDMLVRRLCRRFISTCWSEVSRLTFCNYVPDSPSEWFLWRSSLGDLEMTISKQPASWSEWRKNVSSVNAGFAPPLLLRHPKWILPFALTYPHRMNRTLSAVVDGLIGQRSVLN